MWHLGHGVNTNEIHRTPIKFLIEFHYLRVGLKGIETVQNEKQPWTTFSNFYELEATRESYSAAVSYGKRRMSQREDLRTIYYNGLESHSQVEL